MKKEKTLKIVKITLITIGTIIAAAIICAVVVFNLLVKPHSEEIITAVEDIVKDEEIQKAIEPYLEIEYVDNIVGRFGDDAIVSFKEEVDNYIEKKQEKEKEAEKEKKSEPAPENGNEAVVEKKTSTVKKPKKPASAYSSKYEYVKDNVSASDFSKGVALASKIDVGYVLGLVSGGLSSEEKSELKVYLTSRMSSSEIALGISLYSKYSYLLK